MTQVTQFVGIDLHQDSVALAVLPEGAVELSRVERMANEPARIRRFFEHVAKQGPVRACYEASGSGFVLHRALTGWGHACDVVAPSLIPKRPGDRVKTDRRDAEKLARLHRAGELTAVRVPSKEEEQDRSLVRAREMLTEEILASRHYVLKLLQVRGQKYREGKNWTEGFWAWLRGVALEGEDATTLGIYLELLEHKLALRRRVDEKVQALAQKERWKGEVARLRCLRGIDTLSALTLACEIGDARRFSNARQLMAYIGLGVRERSSGGSQHRSGITKTGNAHCRRVLVEAAWHYRHPPRLGKGLEERQQGQPEAVCRHAMRAQRRLYRRFSKLEVRMNSSKAATAIARELVGFVWALLRGDESLLAARAPRA